MDTAVLSFMRSSQLVTMTDSATRYRKTLTPNGAGGFTETTTQTDYACRVGASKGAPTTQMIAGHKDIKHVRTITFPYDADVKTGDMLSINGHKYAVMDVPTQTVVTAVTTVCEEVP